MSFQPIVPFSGMAGWAFLQRTRETQQETFNAAPVIQRDTDYFSEKIGEVTSAQDLVGDYRLLKVALGAFGLDDDLPNKAFVQRVLEQGTLDPESLANRMSDTRYAKFAAAFGFDLTPPKTQLSDFAAPLVEAYRSRQFEIAVGEVNTNMRLVMSLERDLPEIAERENTSDGRWFAVMGNAPLRRVFQTALGLPSTMATLDLDQQLAIFRDRAERVFGNGEIDSFTDPDARADLERQFLSRSQLTDGNMRMSSGQIALTLLQGG